MNEKIMATAESVARYLQDSFDDIGERKCSCNITVEVQTVLKNNVERIGIVINDGSGIAPAYYVEDRIAEILEANEGDASSLIFELADEIQDLYLSSNKPQIDTEKFLDKEFILSNVTTKIICSVGNEAMLENIEHTPIEGTDLEVIYTIVLKDGFGEGFGNAIITEKHLQSIGITHDELKNRALYNLTTSDYMFTSIEDELFAIAEHGSDNGDTRNKITLKENLMLPMYIFKSDSAFGASAILLTGVLSEIAEKMNDDLAIIPSSIHELLIVPFSALNDTLNNVIKEVNGSAVSPEDRLSDHGYIFRITNATFENL